MMSQLASVGTLVMSGLTVRGESAVAGKWGQTPFSPRLKPHVKMGSDPISHRRHGPLQPVQDFHHGLLRVVFSHSCFGSPDKSPMARRTKVPAELDFGHLPDVPAS